MDDSQRQLLRHFLATLAYRTKKALQDAPAAFATYRTAAGVRAPQQLLHHMSSVLTFALSYVKAVERPLPELASLAEEETRFFSLLEQLGTHLSNGDSFTGTTAERLLQGPFSDAMTHAGQLAMLRRLAGSAIRPENFHAAAISAEHLGAEQPAAVAPAAQWLDAEGKSED